MIRKFLAREGRFLLEELGAPYPSGDGRLADIVRL